MKTQSLSGMQSLLEVMSALRDPDTGCPWDLKQTFSSIVPHTLEEAYEVADAIYRDDMDDIKAELGDLLFQVVFYSQLAAEKQTFTFDQVAQAMTEKLIRRHPHVFSTPQQDMSDEGLNRQWQAIKKQERKSKSGVDDSSILSAIPEGLAPLMRATKIQKKCATVGFDWPDLAPVVDKVREEVDEIAEAQAAIPKNQQHVEEEVGDLLFAVVNLARHLDVDPERALHLANNKFINRFQHIERHFSESGVKLRDTSLDDMEAVWQQAKQQHPSE